VEESGGEGKGGKKKKKLHRDMQFFVCYVAPSFDTTNWVFL
jgi:hypothetical protein